MTHHKTKTQIFQETITKLTASGVITTPEMEMAILALTEVMYETFVQADDGALDIAIDKRCHEHKFIVQGSDGYMQEYDGSTPKEAPTYIVGTDFGTGDSTTVVKVVKTRGPGMSGKMPMKEAIEEEFKPPARFGKKRTSSAIDLSDAEITMTVRDVCRVPLCDHTAVVHSESRHYVTTEGAVIDWHLCGEHDAILSADSPHDKCLCLCECSEHLDATKSVRRCMTEGCTCAAYLAKSPSRRKRSLKKASELAIAVATSPATMDMRICECGHYASDHSDKQGCATCSCHKLKPQDKMNTWLAVSKALYRSIELLYDRTRRTALRREDKTHATYTIMQDTLTAFVHHFYRGRQNTKYTRDAMRHQAQNALDHVIEELHLDAKYTAVVTSDGAIHVQYEYTTFGAT